MIVGDVTGVMPFTHVATYRGRIAADTNLGHPRPAGYEGIPRAVFADPGIAAAGLTPDQAEQRGIRAAAVELDLAQSLARPWTYERDPRGHLGLLADADREVLIGAWAVGPVSGERIHQASLAIRTRLPLETLRDRRSRLPPPAARSGPAAHGGTSPETAADRLRHGLLERRAVDRHRPGGLRRRRRDGAGGRAHAVNVLVREAATGREIWEGFEQLMFATGADPVRPALPGTGPRGIHGVQTLDDGLSLRAAPWHETPVEELLTIDLSCAPPFSPPWDPMRIAARKAWQAVEEDRSLTGRG